MPVDISVLAAMSILDSAANVRCNERLEWESLSRVLLEIRADFQDAVLDSQ